MPKYPHSRFRRQEGLPPTRPASQKVLQIEGDPQPWVTLQKVTDAKGGWVKTTRAMNTPAGVLVNTCSRRIGTDVPAEALCLVPGVQLVKTPAGQWRIQ